MRDYSGYIECLDSMEKAFAILERKIPQPIEVPVKDSFVFRFSEETIHAAIAQKLVRVISGLEAALLLNQGGFYQEQSALQRMLDEFGDDITFLAYGIVHKDITELHERFLNDFYHEDFDEPDDPFGTRRNRSMVPRKKIRAYIARLESDFQDASHGVDLDKTLHQTYSGYVHGASSHIMEMYGGFPRRFHVRGMLGTLREESALRDLTNYFYRGFLNAILVAMAFEDWELVDALYPIRDRIEKMFGMDYSDTRQ